jgi:hypothetical protein
MSRPDAEEIGFQRQVNHRQRHLLASLAGKAARRNP